MQPPKYLFFFAHETSNLGITSALTWGISHKVAPHEEKPVNKTEKVVLKITRNYSHAHIVENCIPKSFPFLRSGSK